MTRSPEQYVSIAQHPEMYSLEDVQDALSFWTRISDAVKNGPRLAISPHNDNEAAVCPGYPGDDLLVSGE